MKSPFLSVIIPTLNEEKFVGKLLSDIEKQTFADFEVIVVDGSSQDNTQTVVNSFKDRENIKLFVNARKNVCFQRNFGAEKAVGDILFFIDADVRITADFFELILKQIERDKTDFATTFVQVSSRHPLDLFAAWFTNHMFQLLMFLGVPYMGGTLMIFKKEVFYALKGFDETIIHAEDHELVRRAAKNKYKGKLYLRPRHIISLRRIEREGRLSLWIIYTRSFIYTLFGGKIRKPLFEYKMGGKVE